MLLDDTGMIPSGFSSEAHSSFVKAQSLKPKDMKHLDIVEEEEKRWPPC